MVLVKVEDQNKAKENFGSDPPWAQKLDQMTHCGALQAD